MTDNLGPALAGALIMSAVLASFTTWILLLHRLILRLPLLERVEEPRAERPFAAVMATLAWAIISLSDRIFADVAGRQSEPTTDLLGFSLVISLSVLAVVATLLFGGGSFRWKDAGNQHDHWTESVSLGASGLVAAVLPTALILVATYSFRDRDTQHSLLRLLGETLDPRVIALLTFTAVVVAPISEELLFRVTLQGWLTARIGSACAVPVVSVLFAAVHGWRDGLALLPLALILGYVYDRRNDFLAVVVMHGLFNAANLLLMLLARQGATPM